MIPNPPGFEARNPPGLPFVRGGAATARTTRKRNESRRAGNFDSCHPSPRFQQPKGTRSVAVPMPCEPQGPSGFRPLAMLAGCGTKCNKMATIFEEFASLSVRDSCPGVEAAKRRRTDGSRRELWT